MKGYVTQLSIKLFNPDNSGRYSEIERMEITYTQNDLPATSWKYLQANEQMQLMEKVKYDKINWDRSDGQILTSSESFMIGNNRIKYAEVYDEGVKTAIFTASYVDGKRDFDCYLKSTNSIAEIQQKLTELDESGSYKEERIEKLDENNDGQLEVYSSYMVTTYDERKNLVLKEYFEIVDEIAEQIDGGKMVYMYGSNGNGEITETINQMWDMDMTDYVNIEKIVASDFVFFASDRRMRK